jgi:hypothetical protein
MAACSSPAPPAGSRGTTSTSVSTTTNPSSSAPINPAAIPLGDGHVSTSPRVGYVDSCTTLFGGGGAQASGSWLDSAGGTWDSLTKPAVEGAVEWPDAYYRVTTSGTSRVISMNDLPIDHPTGTFPISPSDPAHQYDANPNSIKPQPTTWTLPLDPSPAGSPVCMGLGPIGVLDDGVFVFDALDAEGRDAGAHEILDGWGEHPQGQGVLHHHFAPTFILDQAKGRSTLIGYAADGYGIYVERDVDGKLLTDADLDACHGRTSPVLWNGKVQDVYHYDVTLEYPYTLGCYHGTPTTAPRGGTPPSGPSSGGSSPNGT